MRSWKFLALLLALAPMIANSQDDGNSSKYESCTIPNLLRNSIKTSQEIIFFFQVQHPELDDSRCPLNLFSQHAHQIFIANGWSIESVGAELRKGGIEFLFDYQKPNEKGSRQGTVLFCALNTVHQSPVEKR